VVRSRAVTAQPALLAVDVGTTAIRAGAFALDGEQFALAREDTPTAHLEGGLAEHDAEELWGAVARVIRATVETLGGGASVEAVAVASVGEAGVPLDAKGEALRPVIAWYDPRGGSQAEELTRALGLPALYRISGHMPDPHFAVCKLMWLRDNEPAVFRQMRSWLSVADLIVQRLSGVEATVPSLASRTLLFDQARSAWSETITSAAGIDVATLPRVAQSGEAVGGVTPAASHVTGLAVGTPVAGAGHDHLCSALAARAGSMRAVDSSGSAEVVVVPIDTYLTASPEEAGSIACYADVVPGGWVRSARCGLSGALVEWARGEFFAGAPLDEMFAEAAHRSGPSGILVYPTFGRAINPTFDPASALGAIVGLSTSHGRADVLHGILEGLCFALRANLDWLGVDGPLRVAGGATRSDLWMQLKADVTGREVEAAELEEATLRGAAVLAGVGAGCYADARSGAAAAIRIDARPVRPDDDRHRAYDAVYAGAYSRLHGALQDINRTLTDIGRPGA
jgi:xylulokinase